jgi:hypothetical protein
MLLLNGRWHSSLLITADAAMPRPFSAMPYAGLARRIRDADLPLSNTLRNHPRGIRSAINREKTGQHATPRDMTFLAWRSHPSRRSISAKTTRRRFIAQLSSLCFPSRDSIFEQNSVVGAQMGRDCDFRSTSELEMHILFGRKCPKSKHTTAVIIMGSY